MKEWRVSAPRKLRKTSYCRREGSDLQEDAAAMEEEFEITLVKFNGDSLREMFDNQRSQ